MFVHCLINYEIMLRCLFWLFSFLTLSAEAQCRKLTVVGINMLEDLINSEVLTVQIKKYMFAKNL